MKKIVIVLVVIAVLAVLGLALIEIDSPELGRALLSRIGERTGMELEAEQFRLSLLRGVTIRGVRGSSSSAEREIDLEIESIRLEHRLLPLLRRSWVFDRIEVENPRVVLRSGTPGDLLGATAFPAALAIPDEEGTEARLVISSILIRKGELVSVSDGEQGLEIRGLRLEIDDLMIAPARTTMEGLSGRGTFATDSIRLGEMVARDSSGPLSLEEGTLRLDGHRFTTAVGEFEAETLEIDLSSQPFSYQLVLEGDPLHVADLLGGSVEEESGTFFLRGAGRGPEKHGLRGDGRIHLPGGEVPSSPYLELIESVLGGVPIVGERWNPADVDFEIADGRVLLRPFTLDTENAQLDVGGVIDLDGPLDLKLRVGARRDDVRVKEVPSELLDLLTDERGRVAIPLVMKGTIDEPRVRPDWEELTNLGRSGAGREAGRKLIDSIERGIRDLFEGD